MMKFDRRVLFVGFGAVARCTLPILLKHVQIPPQQITIMDFEPNEASLAPWLAKGMTFVKDRVTPENLGSLLGRYVRAGDLIIDLAWNIGCVEILQWCHDHDVLYLNTSVELWDPYTDAADHTCNNWTSGGAGSAQVGHSDRIGAGNTSWNSAHPSRGCSQEALVSTGGAGLFYCFAIN